MIPLDFGAMRKKGGDKPVHVDTPGGFPRTPDTPEWLAKAYTQEEAVNLRRAVEVTGPNGRETWYLHKLAIPAGGFVFVYARDLIPPTASRTTEATGHAPTE